MTETEIAYELRVDQSTISRDIKALKLLSQRFVFDLAKSDLAYYYKQCIDGIEEVTRKGWEIFKGYSNLTPRDKLLALPPAKLSGRYRCFDYFFYINTTDQYFVPCTRSILSS